MKRDTDTWITPRHIVDALGPFDLDPCAAVGQPWPTAAHHFTKSHNGLRRRWFGFVWMNPPFSNILPWIEKLADHDNGIALVPVSTSAKYWQRIIFYRAIALFFIEKRLNFLTVKGECGKFNAGFSVALVAFGRTAGQRLATLEGCDSPKGVLIWL